MLQLRLLLTTPVAYSPSTGKSNMIAQATRRMVLAMAAIVVTGTHMAMVAGEEAAFWVVSSTEFRLAFARLAPGTDSERPA
ncbi:hypothetical protein GCM10007036_14720 [Alsobacter metallidurans]|uniref:Uncharacterized protein n=1 Tax=Alsobacter metallidurans TaxID=340221 RepID=A0A917I661_9HYPH|nr:hypothetical protein GCM10007036_14720 [Alsobacter metallidurans]